MRGTDLDVSVAYVLSPGAGEGEPSLADDRMEATLYLWSDGKRPAKKVIESTSVPGGIAKAALDCDLLVIGAAKGPFFRKILFGEIPERSLVILPPRPSSSSSTKDSSNPSSKGSLADR